MNEQILQSSQRAVPLERLFALSVLAGRRTDRDNKSHHYPYMKALVYDVQFDTGSDKIVCLVKFYNESTDTVTEDNNVDVTLSTLDLTSSRTVRKALESAIIAYNGGYALTSRDIVFQSPNGFFTEEIDAVVGYMSPQIDGKSVGNTVVFANSSGRNFLVTEYHLNAVNVSGLGTAPVINLGSNPSNYNDVASSLSLSFAGQAGKFTKKNPDNNATVVASGDSLVCRVATAAILTTTYDFRVFVKGTFL